MNIESVGMAEYRLQVFGRLIKKLRSSFARQAGSTPTGKKAKGERAHLPFGSMKAPIFNREKAEFCEDRNLRIIVLTSGWRTLEVLAKSKEHDAFS